MAIKIPLFNAYVGPQPPANPVNGTIWIDTSASPSSMKIFLNGAWVSSFTDSGISDCRIVSSNITLDNSYHVVLVDATSGNKVIKLPNATQNRGKRFVIKKIDGTSNTVTIRCDVASQTIEDVSQVVFSEQYETIEVISDGSNYKVIG